MGNRPQEQAETHERELSIEDGYILCQLQSVYIEGKKLALGSKGE